MFVSVLSGERNHPVIWAWNFEYKELLTVTGDWSNEGSAIMK